VPVPAVLRKRFNIISFDPRGFGFSTAVRCFPSASAEQKFLSGVPLLPVGAKQDAASGAVPVSMLLPAEGLICHSENDLLNRVFATRDRRATEAPS
jgi:hypothetical protein